MVPSAVITKKKPINQVIDLDASSSSSLLLPLLPPQTFLRAASLHFQLSFTAVKLLNLDPTSHSNLHVPSDPAELPARCSLRKHPDLGLACQTEV